jgi:hypothetical protein
MNIANWECENNNIGVLKTLYNNSGNCLMNGYLGDSVTAFSLDNSGNLEFKSEKKLEDSIVKSTGAILSDSVVIKQCDEKDDRTHYHLFSWDVPGNQYSYFLFLDEGPLNDCYEKIKNNDICLCGKDVPSVFKQLDISFEDIYQILLDQKVDAVDSMLNDAQGDFVGKTSYTL